jgi:hypothetical protein
VDELAATTDSTPAARCVTGRRSNQLNYAPALKSILGHYRPRLPLPVRSSNFLKMP